MKLKQECDMKKMEPLKQQWINYGQELGRRMWSLKGKETDITFDVVEESAAQAGWGILKSEGDRAHATHLKFTLSNCVFCDGLKGHTAKPCCYEMVGTIQGLMDVLFGKRKVEEVECASGPWDACVVEVSQ